MAALLLICSFGITSSKMCFFFFLNRSEDKQEEGVQFVCVCEVDIYLEKLTDVPPSCENLCLRMSPRCVQHLCFDANSVFICHVCESVFVDCLQQADGRGVFGCPLPSVLS